MLDLSKVFFYDVEVALNFFCVTFKNAKSGNLHIFEISERRNDLIILLSFLDTINHPDYLIVSFNGIHYDNAIMSIIHSEAGDYMTYRQITALCFWLSNEITSLERWWEKKTLTKYKYYWDWTDCDIYLYWSQKVRISKKISLKSLAIQMRYPVVMELPYDPKKPLPLNMHDHVLEYNSQHDVTITEWLFNKKIADVTSRHSLSTQHFECMSWDDVKIGYTLLIKNYADRRNLNYKALLKKKPVEKKPFRMGDIILPEVSFKVPGSKSFKRIKIDKKYKELYDNFVYMLNRAKLFEVEEGRKFANRVDFSENLYDTGFGGLHTVHGDEYVLSCEEYIIVDIDVASYYPSLGAEFEFVSRLFPKMSDDLRLLKEERIEDKKAGRKQEADRKKLMLNGGFFGNLNLPFRATYDYPNFLGITINGQMFLLMLSEMFEMNGIKVDSTNTDGVTVRIKRKQMDSLKEIVSYWESITKMEMEYDFYEAIYRRNVNDYIAIRTDDSPEIKKGKVKQKGRTFVTKPSLGDSCNYLILPKALEAYYKEGTDVESFIRGHKNLHDFCASQKVSKKYTVQFEGKQIQNMNRYFKSTAGSQLLKTEGNGRFLQLSNANNVEIANDILDPGNIPSTLDYNWYIKQCKEVIEALSPTQSTIVVQGSLF